MALGEFLGAWPVGFQGTWEGLQGKTSLFRGSEGPMLASAMALGEEEKTWSEEITLE